MSECVCAKGNKNGWLSYGFACELHQLYLLVVFECMTLGRVGWVHLLHIYEVYAVLWQRFTVFHSTKKEYCFPMGTVKYLYHMT